MIANQFIYRLICLAAVIAALLWSTAVNVRESRHAGEPLPIRTLAQIVAAPSTTPAYLHVQAAAPLFSKVWVDDRYCHRIRCVDTFMPLTSQDSPADGRVAAVSMIRTFPGDVGERRHPFNPRDPVIEGQVHADVLSPRQVRGLRAHGIQADERTVVVQRFALHGRILGPDAVDELVPFLICLPIAFVTGLIGFLRLPLQRQPPVSHVGRR